MHGREAGSTRARVTDAAALVLGVAVILAPVAARNYAVGGGFYVTTSQFGPNFYIGNNPRVRRHVHVVAFGSRCARVRASGCDRARGTRVGRRLTPSEVSSYWSNALDFIVPSQVHGCGSLDGRWCCSGTPTEMLDTESQESHAEWSTLLSVGGMVGHFGLLVPLALLGVIATWPSARASGSSTR